MSLLTGNWSLDPLVFVAALVVAWHEVGLARLARRSRPERTRQRRLRSVWFYAGLAVLAISVCSPLDYWSGVYFFDHMIMHLLLMFAAPALIVAGAPWQPLQGALPRGLSHGIVRSVARDRWARPLRAAGRFARGPWFAVAFFSAVMIAWHIPALFSLADSSEAVHIWGMHGSFVAAGVLFWLQFIPSPPLQRSMPVAARLASLAGTNLVMWILAMTLAVFTHHSWYVMYDHAGVMSPLASQQLGAAILWVCGDFWALPMIGYTLYRLLTPAREPAPQPRPAG